MRILFVIASLGAGGAETLVRNLAGELKRRGHSCGIAYVSEAGALNASQQFEDKFIDDMISANVRLFRIGHSSRSNPFLGAYRLSRLMSRFRPDILHIHVGYGLLLRSLFYSRIPVYYTHHNIRRTFRPVLFKVFDIFVTKYVAICGPCKNFLEAYVRRPITSIANGAADTFSHRPARPRLPRDILALSVGSLRPEKDHLTLVRAARLLVQSLAKKGRRIHFSIAGDGPLRGAIEEAIGRYGLGEHVTLLGVRQDVPELMEKADLVIQSSASEGMPIVLIEAAMSALPAIATDVGGCADVVQDGKSGYIVPPGDPKQLAGAVEKMLGDEKCYVAFSAAAKRHGSRFTIAACADAHLALYHSRPS